MFNHTRALLICTGLCAAALFVALALPALRGDVYTANDLGEFHLPLRSFYADCLSGGDAFDWCPDLYCGFYLTGEGQTGSYHPVHWLLYRYLPLPAAWNIECLVSYPLMFAGMLLLLRRWTMSAATACFGALMLTFAGFNLLHFVHVNAVAVVAHVPWLLYCIDRYVQSLTLRGDNCRRARRLAWCGIAALTASQLLLGYPQYVVLSLVAEAMYLAAIMLTSHLQSGARWRTAALWSSAKALGFAIAAVQLLPTFDALSESVRAVLNDNFVASDFAASGSLHPLNLLQLVAPYLFETRVVGQNTHELGMYVGAVPLLLAMIALSCKRRSIADDSLLSFAPSPARSSPPLPAGEGFCDTTRVTRRFAIGLVVLGLLLALGEHGPLHWLVSRLPIVGQMRFPCRAIVLVQLGIVILAAIGFGRLIDGDVRAIGAPVWLCVAASFVVPGVAAAQWPAYLASPELIVAGPLLFSAAAGLLCFRKFRLALCGLVVLTAIDLGCYGLSYAVYRDAQPFNDFINATKAPAGEPTGPVVLETAQAATLHRAGNRILLTGWQRADGYAGLEPAKRLDYRNPLTWYVAGVTWTASSRGRELPNMDTDLPSISRRKAVGMSSPLFVPKLQTAKTESLSEPFRQRQNAPRSNWLATETAAPRARLVGEVRASSDAMQDLGSIDHETTALVDVAVERMLGEHLRGEHLQRQSANDGSVKNRTNVAIISDRPGHIQLQVQCDKPMVLVLTESFHSGWVASCNDSTARTMRVNGDFLGCVIEPGRHTVEMRFEPDSLRHGRLVSVCGLGLWMILLAGSLFIRPTRPEIDV